jgi:putative spermidine/putrescine transport system ATP-binding protein
MQLELKALHKRLGITFVYVTHDQSEALTMSNRVAVFDQGVIQQLAAVDQLYEYPENQFVAGFIGDNNRFLGMIESVDGLQAALRLADGSLLTGVNVNAASAGQTATACIRPERIRLAPLDAASPNALHTIVHSLIYFGDHVRVRCSLAHQEDCFVKLRLSDPALSGLTEGTHVALDLNPDHLRIFI